MRSLIILMLVLLNMCGCVVVSVENEDGYIPKTDVEVFHQLKEIVYKKGLEHTLYLAEDGNYTPYLVIDDNYNGNVLLLRKYLLDEEIAYKDTKFERAGGSYYPDSEPDVYLNTAFLKVFSENLQDIVIDSQIEVATRESADLGGSVRDTEIIERKIFLLSATELGIRSNLAAFEGKALPYCKPMKNIIATDESNNPQNHWLRSPYLLDGLQVWTVSSTGLCGDCSVSLKHRVRPALCLSGETKIVQRSDVIDGQVVYTLAVE